jgi:FKBP-type peptidyl-prolyl cis-trans isomerase
MRLAFALVWLVGCAPSAQPAVTVEPLPTPPPEQPQPTPRAPTKFESSGPVVVLPSGLAMQDLRVGTGEEAHAGDTVTVHYVGTLLDGTKFDSSRSRGQPIVVRIGVGQVIKGWDEGVVGMRVGQVRVLKIPPDLGYGPRGHPPIIPANATLVFEIELLAVR